MRSMCVCLCLMEKLVQCLQFIFSFFIFFLSFYFILTVIRLLWFCECSNDHKCCCHTKNGNSVHKYFSPMMELKNAMWKINKNEQHKMEFKEKKHFFFRHRWSYFYVHVADTYTLIIYLLYYLSFSDYSWFCCELFKYSLVLLLCRWEKTRKNIFLATFPLDEIFTQPQPLNRSKIHCFIVLTLIIR